MRDTVEDIETCPQHKELLELAKSTHLIVQKIDIKLLGDYDKPGLITEVEELKKFKVRFEDTKALERISDSQKKIGTATRLVYWLFGLVGSGAVAFIWKMLDGSLSVVRVK